MASVLAAKHKLAALLSTASFYFSKKPQLPVPGSQAPAAMPKTGTPVRLSQN